VKEQVKVQVKEKPQVTTYTYQGRTYQVEGVFDEPWELAEYIRETHELPDDSDSNYRNGPDDLYQ